MLRSKGLGAELVPPLSLVADDLGIAHDPARESRLERLIAEGPPPGGEARAERLVARMLRAGLTKYNLEKGGLPLVPKGYTVLVPGQVEDDASVLLGAGAEHTNLALLQRVRRENPAAVVLYKPHPDVEAGLRLGRVEPSDLKGLADVVLTSAARSKPSTRRTRSGRSPAVWGSRRFCAASAWSRRGCPSTPDGA